MALLMSLTFEEQIASILYKIHKEKTAQEEIHPNIFYETSITLLLTPAKDLTGKKIKRQFYSGA